MIELVYLLITSYTLGFIYSIVPGPVTLMAIMETLKKDLRSGLIVILGAQFADFTVVIPLILTLRQFITTPWVGGVISLAGGVFLLFTCFETLKSARSLARSVDIKKHSSGSHSLAITGYLTNLFSPLLWLFWLTSGSAMIYQGLAMGIGGILAFLAGFYPGVISWGFTALYLTSKGKSFLTSKRYRTALIVCATLLAGYGIYFLINGLSKILY